MKLQAFRVQNFKRIQDTGWVDCSDLMVFVGKNEAGKTALLRGLSKLMPTDGEKYNGLKEFPHGRFTDEFKKQDWPVASGRFVLDAEERAALGEVCEPLRETKTITITRHYSDKTAVEFSPEPELPEAGGPEWTETIKKMIAAVDGTTAPDGKGDAWKPVKQSVRTFLDGQVSAASQPVFTLKAGSVEQVRKHLL
ncbi:MAG: AAA family ATPase, partial [Planctomycetota bacterium]